MPWPLDVRFESPDHAIVAAGKDGVFRVSLDDPTAAPEVVVSGNDVTFASRLAFSDRWMVAGATFGPLGWKARGPQGRYREDVPMGVIMDLDAAGDEVWMLGSRRDSKGRWAPEGVILWSANLAGANGGSLGDLKPRLYADSGPGAREMARCHILELGAVRSLGDGRWAVVPGVQPGVDLFAHDGRLLRTWQTEPLGFTDHCDLDKEEFLRLNGEPGPRARWLNQRRTLDDLLPWDGQPALVIRRPGAKGPEWDLVVLRDDGAAPAVALPLGTVGPNTHLRGDVMGDRVVLLLVEYVESPQQRTRRPRLVVLERKEM